MTCCSIVENDRHENGGSMREETDENQPADGKKPSVNFISFWRDLPAWLQVAIALLALGVSIIGVIVALAPGASEPVEINTEGNCNIVGDGNNLEDCRLNP